MRILGLVPARGGSKGVPRKNARHLGGKPLVQYTLETALAAGQLSRVVVSTDDPEIAEIARRNGAEVPFMRPAHLAADETAMLPVVQHALRELENRGDRFEAVCLLQPSHPFREPEEIAACIELLEQSDADAVVTVLPVPVEYHPCWMYFADSSGLLRLSTGADAPISRRQDLPAAFHRDGSVYLTRRDVVMESNSLYGRRLLGYVVNRGRRINIDTPEDWAAAERLLGAGVA
jgi:CMP-N,N'-diacetyllegionaminic acid synthase